MDLADVRDIVVIAYGIIGLLLFLVLLVVAVSILFAVRGLRRTLRDLIDDPVRPTLQEVRQTAENVRGASEFATDTAIHPLIRIVSMGRGVRRGVGVVTGLTRRRG